MITVQAYHRLTDQLCHVLDASHATMHVHVGLALYLGAQLWLRDRRASFVALHVVFAAELLNECLDWLANDRWSLSDTASDIVLTMMWPIAITAVGRYRRARWQRLETKRKRFRASKRRMVAQYARVGAD